MTEGQQEPVAWRILCTTDGATGYLYTEALPFDPGYGVRVRREPEPLYAAPQPAVSAPARPSVPAEVREALEEIISWRNDTLWSRSTQSGFYPTSTEGPDNGARMAFRRCADRAAKALAALSTIETTGE